MGRFTQRDPAGFADGINPYVYVGNSPTNFTDPLGLARQTVTAGRGLQSTYGGQGNSNSPSTSAAQLFPDNNPMNSVFTGESYLVADASDIKFTYGFQGGVRAGITKLLGVKIDVDTGSRETSLITGKEYVNESYAVKFDLMGFSLGVDASRNREISSFVRGKDSITNLLRGKDFDIKPVFETPWNVSSKEFWKIDFGISLGLGLEGTLDLNAITK